MHSEGLFRPVDIRWLVVLRVGFGALMLWEAARYLTAGWIDAHYVDPVFHFTYYGFEWVRPFSSEVMHGVFVALGLFSCGIALGAWYRASTIGFFLTFTYIFLLEQARYLNHFYLICLIGFLMIFLPANRAWSIDARRRPEIASGVTPGWTLWLLRFQIGIVYFYAGVAKMNVDWLQGRPLRMWLAERADWAVIGPFIAQDWVGWAFSYVALFLDLLAWPLLLWRRTRMPTFVLLLIFHAMNKALFSIGVFPPMMVAVTTIFFAPDWPKRFGMKSLPPPGSWRPRRGVVALVALWVLFQVLVPLRHFAYPGYVSWNELGHRFAWHMKLRDKDALAVFYVLDLDTGEFERVDPKDELTSWQARKMAGQPDMILQYAHFLADRARAKGAKRVEVRAQTSCSLNGRDARPLVDPSVNLALQERTLGVCSWVRPFEP